MVEHYFPQELSEQKNLSNGESWFINDQEMKIWSDVGARGRTWTGRTRFEASQSKNLKILAWGQFLVLVLITN